MARRRLFWQILPTYLLVAVVALLAWHLVVLHEERELRRERVGRELEAVATFAATTLSAAPGASLSAVADSLGRALARGTLVRLTVVLADGRVVADSHHESPQAMENHDDRPEVRRALAGETGVTLRHSRTLRKELLYAAVPVRVPPGDGAGEIVAVVRASLPASEVKSVFGGLWVQLGLALAGILLLAVLTSVLVARRVVRPALSMSALTARYSRGELNQRVLPSGPAEIAELAGALNQMGARLAEKIGDLRRRNHEQRALFAGMVEGVVAVDADERIISINRAAAELFGIDPDRAEGRHLEEVIRNASVQRFIVGALHSTGVVEEEITLHQDGEIFLQAHGTVLHDAEGHEIGAVVVFNDVTRLRRLEEVRRDFVANVSHELRTPVTSIKGFLETLRDGDLEDAEHVRRFVDIASRQADRLHAIIEDLLTLSLLERGSERAEAQLSPANIRPILQAALHTCTSISRDRDMQLVLECPPDLEVACSETLLGQAIVNLVDNAIKYSDPGKRVHVSAGAEGDGVFIRVRDWGCGIPGEHLPRLFERFYTVDRARSRGLGGTGLGLAIVKHIVIAHDGEISVESRPGDGSLFTIRLPRHRSGEAADDLEVLQAPGSP